MFQKLSYFNLFGAVIFLLLYLRTGTFNSTAGILMVILFNWLALKSFETEVYKWKLWHYLIGIWCAYFIGTLLYGSINILLSVIEFDFITTDTLIYLLLSFIFSLSVSLHIIYYFILNFRKDNV